MPNIDITALIQDFATKLIALTEAAAADRIQAAMATAFGQLARRGPGRPKTALAPAGAAKPSTSAREAPKATAKLARARKLQGQYLGALRALGAGDRAKVKAVAKSKSVAEAVKLALSLKKPKA
jgi:hypothetical protein